MITAVAPRGVSPRLPWRYQLPLVLFMAAATAFAITAAMVFSVVVQVHVVTHPLWMQVHVPGTPELAPEDLRFMPTQIGALIILVLDLAFVLAAKWGLLRLHRELKKKLATFA